MRFRGELRCLHCARPAGTVEWTEDAVTAGGRVVFADAPARRCPHCAGPVYLEEAEPVRVEPAVPWEKPRRGRPPKAERQSGGYGWSQGVGGAPAVS